MVSMVTLMSAPNRVASMHGSPEMYFCNIIEICLYERVNFNMKFDRHTKDSLYLAEQIKETSGVMIAKL